MGTSNLKCSLRKLTLPFLLLCADFSLQLFAGNDDMDCDNEESPLRILDLPMLEKLILRGEAKPLWAQKFYPTTIDVIGLFVTAMARAVTKKTTGD